MKKYIKEMIMMLIQLLLYYVFPIFAIPDPMGMVLFMLLLTLVLSLVLGIISGSKLKFIYPLYAAIVFIPSVFIFYNDSALIHALWYLVVSAIGLAIGSLIRLIAAKDV